MSADTGSTEICLICKESLSDGRLSQVRQKGADGLNAASVARGDSLVFEAGCQLHMVCRARYTNKKYIQLSKRASTPAEPRRSQRVPSSPFKSDTHCLFCGKQVTVAASEYSHVSTHAFTATTMGVCERRSDDWATAVKARIQFYGGDLHAAGSIYHHACSKNFQNGQNVPRKYQDDSSGPAQKRAKVGRPVDPDQEQAFLKMCAHLEKNEEELFTIPELVEKMGHFLKSDDSSPYSRNHLKTKLIEKYRDAIFITEGEGLTGIVTFRETISHILHSFYRDGKAVSDEETQKRATIDAAARLITSEIRESLASATDHYPTVEDLALDSALDFIPETLRSLLNKIFSGKHTQHKVASIGQAIVQAARPRAVIAPLQIGLAVQMHHRYRSKFLVDTLSKMGFSSSYSEVLRFQKNAASCGTPDSCFEGDESRSSSWLFAADNVDHNAITLDGKGTFHGVGMIAAEEPGFSSSTGEVAGD